MKPGLLILQARPQKVLQALSRDFQVHDLARADDPDAMLREVAPHIRGIVTNGRHGAGAELIAALPNLEIICCFGVGFESVDLASVRARNIMLTNAPGTNDVGVVEMALLLMLAVARDIIGNDRFVRADRWRAGRGHPPRGHTIAGKRLGVVGLGRIGAGIARRATALDMTVAYYGPRGKPEVAYRYYPEISRLAADSDYLVLSCPGGADTYHLVDQAVLKALGTGGVLINVARGSVADPVALIAALKDGTIAGAGLDVFEGEPNLPEELFALKNVVLAPHMGAITEEALDNGTALLLDNLRAHFTGKPVLTPVES